LKFSCSLSAEKLILARYRPWIERHHPKTIISENIKNQIPRAPKANPHGARFA
jgi:hypothetical protein